MTPSSLSRAALRLHWLAIGLLTLQLIVCGGSHPLVWGGLLLTLMAGLKLAESRRSQDLQRAALAELMAVGVLTLLAPELGPSLLQATTAVVVVGGLLCQEAGDRRSLGQALWRSLQLALAALPLLLLLFLLMPRIGPPWSVQGQSTGRTGLSDQLDTGTISRLVQDPAPAARVSYLQGSPPPPSERYWRVLVLNRFDGRRWSAPPAPLQRPRRRLVGSGRQPQQIWVTEPSPVAALPWPGVGLPSDPNLQVNGEGVLQGETGSGSRRRYGLAVGDNPAIWQRRPPEAVDLTFPLGSNPRLEALGRAWASRLPPAGRVEAARSLFKAQGLRYTLSPATLPDGTPLDALLFTTREGFCEHFASAFTALMRAAGVPARVVVGYQGGEWIPDDGWGRGYLDVRQRDAHAWSEVWLEPDGWVRVDPTGWVAPQRIAGGVMAGLGDAPADRARLEARWPWWRQLERTWTKLDLAWNRWVLSFDVDRQERLLGPWRAWQGALLMGGLGLVLPPVIWWLQRQSRSTTRDAERQRLERCIAAFEALGLKPEPGESLDRFHERAGRRHPSLGPALADLSRCYQALRFAPATDRQVLKRELHQAERRLRRELRRLSQAPLKRLHLGQG